MRESLLQKKLKSTIVDRVLQYRDYVQLKESMQKIKNEIFLTKKEIKTIEGLIKNKEKEIKAIITLLEKAAGHQEIEIDKLFTDIINRKTYSYSSDALHYIRNYYFSCYRIMKDFELDYYLSGKSPRRFSMYKERKYKFEKVRNDIEKILSSILGYKVDVLTELNLTSNIESVDFEIDSKIKELKNNAR